MRARAARRLLAMIMVVVLAAMAGCNAGRPEGNLNVPAKDALDQASGVTTINFWHSMDASNGIALQGLVDKFNAEHADTVKVDAVFQGQYDDAITKYKASVQSNTTPSMVQIYDIGSHFMIDSQQVVPIAGFASRDGYDLKAVQRNIAGYYTDPVRFGAAIYGWLLEQFMSTGGRLYCDLDNGRSGQRVTTAALDDATVVQAVAWWQRMVADGLAVNTGRTTKDAQDAFKAGQTAMTLESTGSLKSFTAAAQGKYELGAAPYPTVTGSLAAGAGPSIGGASMWISGPGHSEAEKEAAWQFTQFLVTPESQATWHTQTGYFPVNPEARTRLRVGSARERGPGDPPQDRAAGAVVAALGDLCAGRGHHHQRDGLAGSGDRRVLDLRGRARYGAVRLRAPASAPAQIAQQK